MRDHENDVEAEIRTGALGLYSYPKTVLRGQSQDLKRAFSTMTREKGRVRKVRVGRRNIDTKTL